LVKKNGRIGMLVPRSFMFLKSFQEFREDFIGGRGSFDFLAEFGIGILDNATVRTAGTVVRSDTKNSGSGTFIRLDDVEQSQKEHSFLHSAFVDDVESGVRRLYRRDPPEFSLVPGTALSYWVPKDLRILYDSPHVLDKKRSGKNQDGLGDLRQGIATGNDSRFLRAFWESPDDQWVPFAKGGSDAWLMPRIVNNILWGEYGREIRRSSGGNGTPSEELYFKEGLTYTVAKESGKRFGHLPSGSIFGHKGSVLIPDRAIWQALSYTNSHLFTYLMLAQTTERMWEVGQVSKIPWSAKIEKSQELRELSRKAVSYLISKRQYDFISPYYTEPILLQVIDASDRLPQYDHPHRALGETLEMREPTEVVSPDKTLTEIGTAASRHLEKIEADLQSCADEIDQAVFDCFDITDSQRETVLQEISLRTNENPQEREEYDPEAITEPSEDFPEMVKDLILHLALRIVHEDDDGIVPLCSVEDEADLLSRIENEFERLFSEHASARLSEVDQVLGSQTADEEAYPNLREWLEDGLFDYHVSKFDRSPILWRFTTDRLVSDPKGEGFACLVDYHQLDRGVFDRLQNRYLEPRKALLRERRSAANRRRSDDSLSTSEQAEAAEEYAICESGLEQISVFEDRLTELAQPKPREWPDENRKVATTSTALVSEFREQTAERLEKLDELAALEDVDMEDLFSPSFYETVQKNHEEWLDALDDLETALEGYAKDGSEPVEAHLYDLFEYFDDLVGSAHYASNGILFTTYYYDKFEDASQTTIADDGDTRRAELLADLASDLDEYKEIAEEIADACDEIAADIPSDWSERALSEITTAGYSPNRKHGVVINIMPLVDAEIVPVTVDKQVI
jgi:hypothetical protein